MSPQEERIANRLKSIEAQCDKEAGRRTVKWNKEQTNYLPGRLASAQRQDEEAPPVG